MFCFYYQYQMHRQMDRHEKPGSPGLRRHLSRCTACRDYYDRMVRLESNMKESACGQLSDIGLGHIETSILNSIKPFTSVRQPVCRTVHWKFGAIAAGLLIIAGLSGWFYQEHHRNIRAMTAANHAIASLNGAAAYSDSVSLLNLLSQQSVRQEMDNLVNQAQDTVIYIANCIPQEPQGN
jgi:predicted anti-sigma-YlaC factor YlaD